MLDLNGSNLVERRRVIKELSIMFGDATLIGSVALRDYYGINLNRPLGDIDFINR